MRLSSYGLLQAQEPKSLARRMTNCRGRGNEVALKLKATAEFKLELELDSTSGVLAYPRGGKI